MRVYLKWRPVFYVIGCVFLVIFGVTNLDSKTENVPLSTTTIAAKSVFEDLENLTKQVGSMFENVPNFGQVDCDAIISGLNGTRDAKVWKLPKTFGNVWETIESAPDQCQALKAAFVFPDKAFSKEEADFGLAYGAIVYKEISQVAYMLSSFYQPQNVFVMVVDGKAAPEFKRRMDLFADCFPNIHVMQATDISWCGYGVVRAVFGALKLLSQLNQPWKYFQYLSGFDLPLKTNLELVRIFKQLDGAFISEVTAPQKDRISVTNETSPVPLFKSSLSATFSRASADFIVESEVVRDLLSFLKNTRCPDESLWTTMAGNPQILPMPGAFDGKKFLQFRKKDSRLPTYKRIKAQQNRTKRGPGERFVPSQYYISRYQIWSPNKACKGKYKSGSCVFGVADLPNLVKRAELVAHKLYLDFQPAAYFCLLKNHWNRALNARNQRKFSAKPYSEIAHVELLHGKPFEDLWFYR